MKKNFFLILVFGLLLSPNFVFSFLIEDLPTTEVRGDFLLGPGKIELWLEPGEKAVRQISVTNRLGRETTFKVDIEDFTGSRDPQETVIFLGEEKGPYSLRDFLKPEVREFTLKHGQRITLPIEISIPKDTTPGGRYGAIIVAALPQIEEIKPEKEPRPMVAIVARLANLFFVRVKGDVIENGFLKEFKSKKSFYEKGPISFQLLFENNGTVHLAPYGIIEIKNVLGKKVGELEIDPFFAMPDSLRLREVQWETGFLLGKYTALVSLNRGYQDIIDQKTTSFWVIPWKIILVVLITLFLIVWFFRWFITHFEIRKKTS